MVNGINGHLFVCVCVSADCLQPLLHTNCAYNGFRGRRYSERKTSSKRNTPRPSLPRANWNLCVASCRNKTKLSRYFMFVSNSVPQNKACQGIACLFVSSSIHQNKDVKVLHVC